MIWQGGNAPAPNSLVINMFAAPNSSAVSTFLPMTADGLAAPPQATPPPPKLTLPANVAVAVKEEAQSGIDMTTSVAPCAPRTLSAPKLKPSVRNLAAVTYAEVAVTAALKNAPAEAEARRAYSGSKSVTVAPAITPLPDASMAESCTPEPASKTSPKGVYWFTGETAINFSLTTATSVMMRVEVDGEMLHACEEAKLFDTNKHTDKRRKLVVHDKMRGALTGMHFLGCNMLGDGTMLMVLSKNSTKRMTVEQCFAKQVSKIGEIS